MGVDVINYLNSDAVDRIILGECYKTARNSPDTSTQIGAAIVNPNGKEVLQFSYNGFVRGWNPTEEDFERPRKYLVTEHAERRVIYQAARAGIPLLGCTLYSTWAACADCARAVVESGIIKLVRHHPPHDEAVNRWLESVSLGDEIMKAGNVTIIDIHGPIPSGVPILRGGEPFDPSQG